MQHSQSLAGSSARSTNNSHAGSSAWSSSLFYKIQKKQTTVQNDRNKCDIMAAIDKIIARSNIKQRSAITVSVSATALYRIGLKYNALRLHWLPKEIFSTRCELTELCGNKTKVFSEAQHLK